MTKYILEVGDLKTALLELTNIAIKTRAAQIKWEGEYGSTNKNNKKYWEAKLDNWINQHSKEEEE